MTSVLLTVKGYYLLHYYSCSFSQTETKVFSLSTTGEANVYTLGDIGHHRVVSTKLPMTGSSGSALIATGSTTTRLLGTFQVRLIVFLKNAALDLSYFHLDRLSSMSSWWAWQVLFLTTLTLRSTFD